MTEKNAPSRKFLRQSFALAVAGLCFSSAFAGTSFKQEARDNYPAYLPLAETAYDRQLQTLEDRLTFRMQEAGVAKNVRAIILSPDVYNAVGATQDIPGVVGSRMLAERGVDKPNPGVLFNLHSALSENPAALTIEAATTSPMAVLEILKDKEAALCTVLPSSGFGSSLAIDGFTPVENRDFANAHEACHCLDTENKEPFEDPRRETRREMKSEAFADMCGITDMILSGKPLGSIGALARARVPEEPIGLKNYSTATLQRLAREIDRTGLTKFRRLGTKEHVRLFQRITELETPGLRAIDGLKAELEGKTAPERGTPLPDVSSFNAAAALQSAAMDKNGTVTPESLITARTALRSELQKRQETHPEDLHYPAMILKLDREYKLSMSKLLLTP